MDAMTLAPTSIPPLPPIPPPLLTADEFFVTYENQRAELVRGVVQETSMPDLQHGRICLKVGRYLDEFAELHDLGRVMSNDSFIKVRRNPDSVRGADICFFSYERLPKGTVPGGLLDTVPEMVVEVRSPSESWTELIAKVLDYLAAGVKVVLVFNPLRQAVAAYRNEADEEHFGIEQELTIPDVLPGFAVAVKKFFE